MCVPAHLLHIGRPQSRKSSRRHHKRCEDSSSIQVDTGGRLSVWHGNIHQVCLSSPTAGVFSLSQVYLYMLFSVCLLPVRLILSGLTSMFSRLPAFSSAVSPVLPALTPSLPAVLYLHDSDQFTNLCLS